MYAGLLSAAAYLAMHLVVSSPVIFAGTCLLFAAWFINREAFKKRKSLRVAIGISLTLLLGLAAWIGSSSPAHAVFLSEAQSFFETAFGGEGEGDETNTVIALVFNVIRGIFLIYIAIAFVQVVQSARQEEDWRTLARTPVIIMVAVAVVDVITGFVVPAADDAPAPAPEP